MTTKTQLTAADIRPNKLYRAKRFKGADAYNNDRVVVWIDSFRTIVQYDSDTVAAGRHLPKVSMEKFLKWADREIENYRDV